MALITRLSRLFQADMNAVLDRIEEPELLLKQAIREMEASLASSERQIKLSELEQKKLLNKENELKQSMNELNNQLKLCFESDKDQLARSLVKRKLETTQYLKSVSTKTAHLAETISQLKTQNKERQSLLISMKQKADIFEHENSGDKELKWNTHTFSIQDEDIEVAFLDEKQKWSQS